MGVAVACAMHESVIDFFQLVVLSRDIRADKVDAAPPPSNNLSFVKCSVHTG